MPFLLSSKVLRKYGCGQVDIAYISNRTIYLVEVKSSDLGLYASFVKQKKRLYDTALFLEGITGIPTRLLYTKKGFAV